MRKSAHQKAPPRERAVNACSRMGKHLPAAYSPLQKVSKRSKKWWGVSFSSVKGERGKRAREHTGVGPLECPWTSFEQGGGFGSRVMAMGLSLPYSGKASKGKAVVAEICPHFTEDARRAGSLKVSYRVPSSTLGVECPSAIQNSEASRESRKWCTACPKSSPASNG